MTLIKSCGAEQVISSLIGPWMEQAFGRGDMKYQIDSKSTPKYAVRSSGVLEDGSNLSAAGQNDTFLGVVETDIPSKIVLCWASLFTPQSVQYRL